LDIDQVKEIPPVEEGKNDRFDRLILPKGHKDIVRALVKTHALGRMTAENNAMTRSPQREFDVVKGKGKGLIILLHGSPGVGKTSTAECVAVHARRPLFPITCGDLGGNTAQEVERNLEKFFDLAQKWNCVLLLDEADVFLSSRGSDIRQNSLVSVFLRVLEYYPGVLILTTNRVGAFDEGIKSRVHCALYYPPLSKDDTLEVWRMNLEVLQMRREGIDDGAPLHIDRKGIMRFARRHWKANNRWNGRQIKNAFQTAVALAEWDSMTGSAGQLEHQQPSLEVKHFETVAQASTQFDIYLRQVRREDDTRAKENELRRDDLTLRMLQEPYQTTKSSKSKGGSGAKGKRPPEPSESESISSDESISESESSTTSEELESEVPVETPNKGKKKRGSRSQKERRRQE